MTRWIQVTAVLERAPEDWAVLCDVFDRHGIPGTVQTDQPPTLSGYLVDSADSEGKVDLLRADLLQFGAKEVTETVVPDEDWAESWKQFFKPREIGERFLVRPTWEEPPAVSDRLEIVLDPGQAFGTGDHPTTRLCLELMERVWKGLDLRPEVADIGCGSGILTVAACLLGCKSAVGVDIDAVSVNSAKENGERNAVAFEVFEGTGFDPLPADASYDVVLSNIISAALIALAPEASRRVRIGGFWIVSGIIEGNWKDVEAAAVRNGFAFTDFQQEGDWVAATFLR
ncbi:MAG: 50S ribosomal protein L11 methyltransferase [Fimbriimonadaceae bacterium]|nr:50S ribosomal protein L11 methyltransferase [Fimbriimonadaceae bacterium]